MSTSTDGLLVYGIPLVEETELFDYTEEQEESDTMSPLASMAYNGHKLDGCFIEKHCSNEFPMYFIAVQRLVAHRGNPAMIDIEELSSTDAMKETLNAFVQKHKIPSEGLDGGPGWYLASYWG